MVERSVFLGGAYELHVRVLGGELLIAPCRALSVRSPT
jgi:hypothetical protein